MEIERLFPGEILEYRVFAIKICTISTVQPIEPNRKTWLTVHGAETVTWRKAPPSDGHVLAQVALCLFLGWNQSLEMPPTGAHSRGLLPYYFESKVICHQPEPLASTGSGPLV